MTYKRNKEHGGFRLVLAQDYHKLTVLSLNLYQGFNVTTLPLFNTPIVQPIVPYLTQNFY